MALNDNQIFDTNRALNSMAPKALYIQYSVHNCLYLLVLSMVQTTVIVSLYVDEQ